MSGKKIAEVVLFAEFDIDKGSTLRQSYPTSVPNYSPEFFADFMLPEGVHNREEDFTICFLNRKTIGETNVFAAEVDSNETQNHQASLLKKNPLEEFMYCFSVVRTTYDNTVRRGAKVKAVALCSPYKFCFALKDILDLAARKIAFVKDEVEARAILEQLYNVINAVDISGVTVLTKVERRLLKRTVSARTMDPDTKHAEDTLFYNTNATWDQQKIPLKIKLCSTEDQHDTGLVRKLLTKFGEQTMILYNAVLTGARIIVLGYNQPAGDVCSYVLALSALVCPPLFGLIHRQYPYANLTDLSFLSTDGFIAGVTNPMFKTKKEWWDICCDIASGEVFVSQQEKEKEEYENLDRHFILEVLDGMNAGFGEEWVRCMFEEYTRQNVVDIAFSESPYADMDNQVKKIAVNNKRITRWARTNNYKQFMEDRKKNSHQTEAFNVEKTGVDLKRHIRFLQSELLQDDVQVEQIYTDFEKLLKTEEELKEFLSHLPLLRGGLQNVAQGVLHSSMGVKHNTVTLLNRLEQYPSTQTSLRYLNPFIMMTYQRLQTIIQPQH